MTAQCALRHSVRWSSVVLLAGALVAPVASAQSLGDVARRENARRQAVPAGKVYTNDSLPAVEAMPAPSARAAGAPQAGDAQAPAAGTPAPPQAAGDQTAGGTTDAKRDETYWRARVAAEREALGRAESFAEALQSRINALSTDFVNRDDPAQRNLIAADRQKALDELARVQKEIAAHRKTIDATSQEARKEGVPAGWLRDR